MSMRLRSRCGVALFLGALVSACSFTGPDDAGVGIKSSNARSGAPDRRGECTRNRNSCIYEGVYEPTERDYAEQEAKRLNQAALDRFRRSARE
jgi:hypothetical protein